MILIDRQGGAAWNMGDALTGTDYVGRLESRISARTGKSAVAVCSSDAALHTALKLCGVRDGDYVFVPTYTFYSDIATVSHAGGVPVFVDCDPMTRCVSAAALETAFVWSKLQNKPPRAVVVSDAFGSVADYDTLLPLCKANGVPLIELACDAFGGEYNGKACGACGDYGVISMVKRVDGGGAVLVLNADERSQAEEFTRGKYTAGENHDYKMHNVIAALDCAKLDAAKKITERAKANLAALVKASGAVVEPVTGDAATYALVKAAKHKKTLEKYGFEVKTPPPVHTMRQYATRTFFEHEPGFCAACSFGEYCFVSMDISAFKRRQLVRLLHAYESKP